MLLILECEKGLGWRYNTKMVFFLEHKKTCSNIHTLQCIRNCWHHLDDFQKQARLSSDADTSLNHINMYPQTLHCSEVLLDCLMCRATAPRPP